MIGKEMLVSWMRSFKSSYSETGELKSLGFIVIEDKGGLELKMKEGKEKEKEALERLPIMTLVEAIGGKYRPREINRAMDQIRKKEKKKEKENDYSQ